MTSPPHESRSPVLLSVISIAVSVLITLLVLELVFRVLPVPDISVRSDRDEQYHLNRFQPDTTVHWAAGWNFAYRTAKRSNDEGYLSDQSYRTPVPGPLLTVIGDSYVEALQVPNGDSLHGRLARALEGRGRVFGIGSSGSSLASYLGYARYARERLKSNALVFVIISNDFDESMCRYAPIRGWSWCFEDVPGEPQVLKSVRQPPEPGLRRLVRRSALLRYIAFNTGFNWEFIRGRLTGRQPGADAYVANEPAQVPPQRLHEAEQAVDLFFRDLSAQAGLPPERILFIVDAIREDIYAGREHARPTFFGEMRTRFMAAARARGYEVVGMEAPFTRDYLAHREKFEYPTDSHWNSLGHYVAADSIAASNVLHTIFGPAPVRLERPTGAAH